ncbi:hypothetical protein REPUB_Repub20aG0129400 [Reevesia pubescens]
MEEIEKMHALIKQYNLHGQLRWIRAQMNRARNGELYRYIADTKGAFVQPDFYEAFGLTVVEAMNSQKDPGYWHKISDGGLKRIRERFTWKIYSERLLTLAGVYGFWKYVSKLDQRDTRRYLEMFYILK